MINAVADRQSDRQTADVWIAGSFLVNAVADRQTDRRTDNMRITWTMLSQTDSQTDRLTM